MAVAKTVFSSHFRQEVGTKQYIVLEHKDNFFFTIVQNALYFCSD